MALTFQVRRIQKFILRNRPISTNIQNNNKNQRKINILQQSSYNNFVITKLL